MNCCYGNRSQFFLENLLLNSKKKNWFHKSTNCDLFLICGVAAWNFWSILSTITNVYTYTHTNTQKRIIVKPIAENKNNKIIRNYQKKNKNKSLRLSYVIPILTFSGFIPRTPQKYQSLSTCSISRRNINITLSKKSKTILKIESVAGLRRVVTWHRRETDWPVIGRAGQRNKRPTRRQNIRFDWFTAWLGTCM